MSPGEAGVTSPSRSFASCLSHSSGQKQAGNTSGDNKGWGGSPYFVLFYTLVFGKNNAKVSGDSDWERGGLGSPGITSCDHQPSAFQGDVRSCPKGTPA